MDLTTVINDFKEYLDKKQALLRSVNLFSWDQSIGAPKGGAASRGKTIGILAGDEFAMTISDEMKRYIDVLGEHVDKLDELTLGLYKKCKREYDSLAKIPVSDYRKYSELVSISDGVWEQAKKNSDYGLFLPYLKEIIKYQKKFIEYRGYKGHPYNTLLDDYEPGMTVEKLDIYFDKIKNSIVPILKKITDYGKVIPDDFLKQTVSKDIQKKISSMIMDILGYDLNRGMLRESEHPFTSSFGKNDVRITTHYYEHNFLSSFYSVAHEVGHALYEQNKKDEIADTFMDEGVSMGIHESQSRFYENIICRSLDFWNFICDDLKGLLGDSFNEVTSQAFYEACNIVKPSLIRIEADELTYSLHILVRYEMEKMIFESDVNIDDLPRIWNEKYMQYLGVCPENDTQGILQDVHWSSGLFGYFPSYSLGSAYSSQLSAYMNQDFNQSEEGNRLVFASKDDIQKANQWLKDKIHQYGSLKTPAEIIQSIAGEELNADYYIQYLEDKYSKLYGL